MVWINCASTTVRGWRLAIKPARNSMKAAGGSRSRDGSGAEKPWRVLLREELRLPWAVMGPRERAPLAREAWICFRDLILM